MRFYHALLILPLLFVAASCIGDSDDNCQPEPESNFSLNFVYPNFDNRIDRINVGIYDEVGILVISKQVEKRDLQLYQGVDLQLEVGNYTAICWGNAFSDTHIDDFSAGCMLAAGKVYHPNYNTLQHIPTNDSLYYGKQRFTVTTTRSQDAVSFTPAHIKLEVQMKGMDNTNPGTSPANYPFIRINNLEAVYDFSRQTQGTRVSYYPPIVVDTHNQFAISRCDVLRFENQNPITIQVVENKTTNNILYTVNLEQFLQSNSIQIEAGKETRISMLITFANGGVVASLNGWGNKPTTPEI